MLLAGIAVAKLTSILKLPDVTGYLLAGVLIGPSVLSLVPANVISRISVLSEVALSFIAYTIGSELNLDYLKKAGSSIIVLTICEALGATLVVNLVMIFLLKQSIPFSIMLGAIAAATAPAATIMVIRQYKAKGPLVDTLIPIVAMDDAVSIVTFGVSSAIAKMLISKSENVSIASAILIPIWQILLALIIGFIIGVLLSYVSNKIRQESDLLAITIGAIFLSVGIASYFDLSTLLCTMMVGATVSNMLYNSRRVISIIDRFTPPLFVIFFTLAGLDLKIDALKKVGVIGIAYIVSRVIGKLLGSRFGARIVNAPHTVQRYLGFTLIPQAGVAIGLAMVAEIQVPGIGSNIKTIILAATVIYELIGPVTAKIALTKAGEIPNID